MEPGILASVIVLGLLVLTAAQCRSRSARCWSARSPSCTATRTAPSCPAEAAAVSYAAGFALATALLHAAGLGIAYLSAREGGTLIVRGAGAAGGRMRRRACGDLRRRHDPRRDHHGRRRHRAERRPRRHHLTVANTGDRPIQVGSHYHFAETNPALQFDRAKARGRRLDIAAGTAVRFEPGQTREVSLVAFAGSRRVFGFRQAVMGDLD